jgi:hypothetical protein
MSDNLTTFMCRLPTNSVNLDLLKPSKPVQACNGIALHKGKGSVEDQVVDRLQDMQVIVLKANQTPSVNNAVDWSKLWCPQSSPLRQHSQRIWCQLRHIPTPGRKNQSPSALMM